MNTIKKRIAAALAVLMTISFAACSNKADSGNSAGAERPSVTPSSSISNAHQPKALVRVGTLKGPTGLGMTILIDNNKNGSSANKYEFTLAGSPDELTGKLVSGELDIATVPSNLAAVLYNNTEGKVQILAVNTLGVLYILTKDEEIQSLEDLEGKTIITSGQGSVPQYVLEYILEKNGLSGKVTVEYRSEHTEVASLLLAGQADVVMLPEPFVTTALQKDKDLKIVIDITDEWEKATGGSGSQLAMGAVAARRDYLEKNGETVQKFLDEYAMSIEQVNTDPADAAPLAEAYDIISASVAIEAIPKCNIVFLDGDEMHKSVSGFLSVLYTANPRSVGGVVPGDDFYYQG